jgi:predicted GNAT family acetyltransferase
MIRKLVEKDRYKLLKYLYVEGSLNIFIIGDVEAFGFDKNFQTIYAEFDKELNYISVLLFYNEHSVFYSHTRVFNEEWLEIYKNHNDNIYMSGAESTIQNLIPYFPNYKVNPMYFSEAFKLTEKIEKTEYNIIKVTTKEHCDKLFDILFLISKFAYKSKEKDKFIEDKMNSLNMGSTYFIEKDGVVVSTVSTTAETKVSAMVIAVATLETARNKGLATILMKHLMNEYFDKKKKYLCLFYDNPKAGNIYKRLGFKDVDKWIMLKKEQYYE